MSCDCECGCCAEEREPTPEEIAEFAAREEAFLAALMTPAASPVAQLERDIYFMEQAILLSLTESFYAPDIRPREQFRGLAAWLESEPRPPAGGAP